jgi:energy-coupling factor transporter ATP-binding protein EcfA2
MSEPLGRYDKSDEINETNYHDEDFMYDDDFMNDDGLEYEDEKEEELDYTNIVNYSQRADGAIFNVFFSYFNFKRNNPTYNEESHDGIKVNNIINGSYLLSNISEPAPSIVDYRITLTYNGVDILMRFNSYIEMEQLQSYIYLNSTDKCVKNGTQIYNDIFSLALGKSNLKGAYMTMPDNRFAWDVKTLDKMGYGDIFLPDDLMDNAKLFINLFKKKGLMSRYLLSGIPGSGKTELTRVLSSILKEEDGVTIIKTNPCEVLKQKITLAKALAPAIIILDDVDLYLGNRNNGNYSFLLGQFLDVLDGVDKLPDNIGIIASTNAPHLIDMAAQRPGRFNKLLFFTSLTKDNIKGIIKKSLKRLAEKYGPIDESIQNKFLDDKLVNFFKTSESSGSYIYETVIDIKNALDVNGEDDFSVDKLITRLSNEKKILKENLKVERINDSYKDINKPVGFK